MRPRGVEFGGGAAAALGGDKVQLAAAEGDGFVEDGQLAIEAAESEIVGGDSGGEGEADRFEEGGGSRSLVAGAFIEAADAAEEVDLPGGQERDRKVIRDRDRKGIVGRGRQPAASDGRVGADLRPVGAAGDAGGGCRLLDAGGGGL